jgi:glycosidase
VTQRGFTADEKSTQDFFKKLLNWRKNNAVIHEGKLTHFGPENGVYVYFRHSAKGKVMVVMNKNVNSKSLSMDHYAELIKPGAQLTDVLTGKKQTLGSTLEIPAKAALVFEVQ